MSGVRGDARKRQQGEHLTHWDAGVRAVIEREVAKAKAEALREAADAVQWVYDMQCPPIRSHFADDEFGRGAVCAHRWWSTVLGGTLRDLRDRAADVESGR